MCQHLAVKVLIQTITMLLEKSVFFASWVLKTLNINVSLEIDAE